MAVYSPLSLTQLKQLLKHYNLGEIHHYEGIPDGIENTNYQVETASGHYVLTIFEHYKAEDLPFYLKLMAFLRNHKMPTPEPVSNSEQQTLSQWQSKPSVLFKQLPGHSILSPKRHHCRQIGIALAQLHTLSQQFPLHKKNDWDLLWIQQTGKQLLIDPKAAKLSADDRQLLSDELLFQQAFFNSHQASALPKGIIHGDLFCDNALFDNDQLSGILDFYTAGHDILLFDLAISINAWCLNNDNHLDLNKVQAMLSAYETIRPLNAKEQKSWPCLLRTAGLRFWLSRLAYKQSAPQAELALDKDPDVLKCLLLNLRETTRSLSGQAQR